MTQRNKTHQLVLTVLLFALALVLSIVENALPPLPIPVPGVKMGLSNIIVMYTLLLLNRRSALAIAVLKSGFVLITQGMLAGFLSLMGGLMSIGVMVIIILCFKEKASYLMISISGAVFHNLGQWIGVVLVYSTLNLWVYLPVLLVSGVIAGGVTATLLKFILPALKRLA